MEHKTTAVELVIQPTDLSTIVHDWAQNTKFSVYEKTATRTIYSQNIRLSSAWLSVENKGQNARIEAWMSPKGVGPDFSGNFWKGQKVAISKGHLFGPVAVYRNQFDKLLGSLSAKSENVTERGSRLHNDPTPLPRKSALVTGIAGLGVITFVRGLIGAMSAIGIVSSSFPVLVERMLFDSIFDMFFGALIFVCSRVLARGKVFAIWLYGTAILMDSVFDISMGYKLNYIFIGFGLLFIWQMLKFKNEWELA